MVLARLSSLAASLWSGTHSTPPEVAEVPPNLCAFSTIRTDSPNSDARSAAIAPAAPEPTTTTSWTSVLVISPSSISSPRPARSGRQAPLRRSHGFTAPRGFFCSCVSNFPLPHHTPLMPHYRTLPNVPPHLTPF